MAWEFKREQSQFSVLPEGDYRVRIKSADKMVAKSGKDMLSFVFEVSGKKSKLFHNIVFLPDRPEITNRQLTQFFDSFKGIPEGDFNTQNWVGKVGAVHVKHEEYNGDTKAAVGYFIRADKAEGLPAWVEPENSDTGSTPASSDGFMNIPDNLSGDFPFN